MCWQCRRPRFHPWVGKIPWRRKWQPTPVLLPGKSHGQRSLVDSSPWGHKESGTTERLALTYLMEYCVCARSCLTLCGPTDCSSQTPPPLEISRQEHWSGFPLQGGLRHLRIEPESPASPALAGRFFTTKATWGALNGISLSKQLITVEHVTWVNFKTMRVREARHKRVYAVKPHHMNFWNSCV